MIDKDIVAVVRRLLNEAHEADRTTLVAWCAHRAVILLTRDLRSRYACQADPVLGSARQRFRELGHVVASKILKVAQSSDGRQQVPQLHFGLLYATRGLGAPPIHQKIAKSKDPKVFARSREFFDSLDDEQIYVALCTYWTIDVSQEAFREFSPRIWRSLKTSVIYLATRADLSLTLIRFTQKLHKRKKKHMTFLGHSKFFAGQGEVNATHFGAFPGRVLSQEEVYGLVRSSSVNHRKFGEEIARELDAETPVFIELDLLTTARLWFLESLSQHEASWAGPGPRARRFNEMGLPPQIFALLIADMIRTEVRKAFGKQRMNGRPEGRRVLILEAATRARLEEYFKLGYFGYPTADWKGVLKEGIARLGSECSKSDTNAVSFQFRKIKRRIIWRIERDWEL